MGIAQILVGALASFVFRTLKIALYGPKSSGKSSFLGTLVGESSPSSSDVRRVELIRTYRFKVRITNIKSSIAYKLVILDLPSAEGLGTLRLNMLRGVSGYIFFYDSTSVDSAKTLYWMIKNELEPNKKFKSALAMIVLATKRDLGADPSALSYGEEIANYLSNITLRYYGYAVPHLLISNFNRESVHLVIDALETIFFEIRNDPEILRKLSVKTESHRHIVHMIEGLSRELVGLS